MGEMMSWREQAALGWKVARWVIWPPDTALWGQFAYKIAQAVCTIGFYIGSGWIVAAACALIIPVVVVSHREPGGEP